MSSHLRLMLLLCLLYLVFIPITQGLALPIAQRQTSDGIGSGDVSISFTTMHATTTATATTATTTTTTNNIKIIVVITISCIVSMIYHISYIYDTFEDNYHNRREPTFNEFIRYFAHDCDIKKNNHIDKPLKPLILFIVTLPSIILCFIVYNTVKVCIYHVLWKCILRDLVYPFCIKLILYDCLYNMVLIPIFHDFLYKKILLGAISKIKHLYYFLMEYINHRNTIVNLESDAVNKECYVCGNVWGTQLEPKQIEDFDTILQQNIDALNALQEIIDQFKDYMCKVIPITLVNCKCKCKEHMCFHCAINNLTSDNSKTCPTCREAYAISNIMPFNNYEIIIHPNDDSVLAQEIITSSTQNIIVVIDETTM